MRVPIFLTLAVSLALSGCERYGVVAHPAEESAIGETVAAAALGKSLGRAIESSHGGVLVVRVGDGVGRAVLFGSPTATRESLGDEFEAILGGVSHGRTGISDVDTPMAVAHLGRGVPFAWDVRLRVSMPVPSRMTTVVRAPAQSIVEAEGLRRTGTLGEQALFEPTSGAFSITTDRRFGAILWCCGLLYVLLLPLSLAIGPVVGWLVSRAVRSDVGARWAYGVVAIPLGLVLPVLVPVASLFVPGLSSLLRAWFGEGVPLLDVVVDQLFCGLAAMLVGTALFGQGHGKTAGRLWAQVATGLLVACSLGGLARVDGPPTVLYLWILAFIPGWSYSLRRSVNSALIDPELTDRAKQLAAPWGLDVLSVRLGKPSQCKMLGNALATPEGDIFLARVLYNRLEPEELDFILAHELAHVRAWGARRERPGLASLFGVVGGVVVVSIPVAVAANLWYGAAFLAPILAVALLDGKRLEIRRHALEFSADGEALRLTGDLHSAISALTKLGEGNKLAHKDTTHPSIERRIVNLREVAATLTPS